jgi:hypothetical protein
MFLGLISVSYLLLLTQVLEGNLEKPRHFNAFSLSVSLSLCLSLSLFLCLSLSLSLSAFISVVW